MDNNTTERFFLDNIDGNLYFSRREAEVLVDVYQGKTAKESGEALDISPRTIEFYRNNIKLKLGCRTKTELVRKAKENGIDAIIERLHASKLTETDSEVKSVTDENAMSSATETDSEVKSVTDESAMSSEDEGLALSEGEEMNSVEEEAFA